MKARFKMLLALTAVLFSVSANAVVEIRGAYSQLMVNPNEFNTAFTTREDLKKFDEGIGGDLILNAAMMPVLLGARYEKYSYGDSRAAGMLSAEFERISVILGKRFIDRTVYLGMLTTVGVSNEFKDRTNQLKASSSLSGSIGLETGLKLGFLMFGIEGGYLIAPLGNLKDSTGAQVLNGTAPVKVDLSGAYGRGVVGFNF